MKDLLTRLLNRAMCCCVTVGLFEKLCDHVRHLHNQLSLEALDLVKSSSASKKKVSPLFYSEVQIYGQNYPRKRLVKSHHWLHARFEG